MGQHDWKDLLDDPDVERTIERVLRVAAFTTHAGDRNRLAYDDLRSWIWDEAVAVAVRYTPDVIDPRETTGIADHFRGFLYKGLRDYGLRQHLSVFYGRPGTPERATSRTSLEAELEAEGDQALRQTSTVSLGNPYPSASDPVQVLLYIERLEERLAQPTRPIEDETCLEPMCPDPPTTAGRCQRHYQREHLHDNPACTVDGCDEPQRSKGLCDRHYRTRRRESGARTCAVDGCKTTPKGNRFVCEEHAGWTPPCSVDGCTRRAASTSTDLCALHRERLRRTGRTGPRQKPTCSVDGCEKPARGRGLCGTHYARSIRRERAAP